MIWLSANYDGPGAHDDERGPEPDPLGVVEEGALERLGAVGRAVERETDQAAGDAPVVRAAACQFLRTALNSLAEHEGEGHGGARERVHEHGLELALDEVRNKEVADSADVSCGSPLETHSCRVEGS